jgi:hypothetical protein
MCAMSAMKLLMKSMFHAWKLDVKKLTNEHRMNRGKNIMAEDALLELAVTNIKLV